MTDADHERPGSASPGGRPIPVSVAVVTLITLCVWGAVLIGKYHYRPSPAPPPMAIRAIAPAPDNPKVAGGGQPAADDRPRAAVLRTAAEADRADGIHPDPPGGVLAKAGDAYLRILDDDRGVRANFGFFTLSDREWEHGYLTQGVRRLTSDDEFARELGLTGDQLMRLRDLPPPPPGRLSDADRDRFLVMYRAWRAAADREKAPAAGRLVESLASYAARTRTVNQRLMEQRVAGIRAILNENQLSRINPIPRWNLPTTTPATRASGPK